MARMKSAFALQGSMGETSFRKVDGKYYAYDKVNVPDSKRKNNDIFWSMRKNATEFGIAANASKLLRDSLHWLPAAQDSRMVNTLNSKMVKMLRLNIHLKINLPASILPQNTGLLLGHNFNTKITLRSVFNTRYTTSINRATGELAINIPSFNPVNCVKAAKYATHFKFVSSAVEIDFNNGKQYNRNQSSEIMALGDILTTDITLTHNLAPASSGILLLVLGIIFIDQTNTSYTTDAEKRKVNPLCIVDMDAAVPVTTSEEDQQLQEQSRVIKENRDSTGLPDDLKLGIEDLTGSDINDVKVHSTSDNSPQLNASAYAKGFDISLAPEEEKPLPNEAWHVVQQKQGRVKPTRELKGGGPVNDHGSLENEADALGNKA